MKDPAEILDMTEEELEQHSRELSMGLHCGLSSPWQMMDMCGERMSLLRRALYFHAETMRLYALNARPTERRMPLLYVAVPPEKKQEPEKHCQNCDHFSPAMASPECGTCTDLSNWLAAMEGSGQ